ncbi:CorA family divalent cation transporter [Clostridium paraputrificum]
MENSTVHRDTIESLYLDRKKELICILTLEELGELAKDIDINERIVSECLNSRTSKFESHDGFDYIALKVPSIEDPFKEPKRICIYFRKDILIFICDNTLMVSETLSELVKNQQKCSSLSKILDIFFDKLTIGDTYAIENIEEEIAELEEGLVNSIKSDYLKEIIGLRKKLLILKRYYEQFYNIAEGIEENENGLIDKKTIKSFRIMTSRINRLYQSVINLRDYVTQVREAYQAQIDINQNNIMKLFTVITTIFLPLTLIVGWYGMNLNMPEYNWNYGYPFVIVISIIVIILCIICFKRKKWF